MDKRSANGDSRTGGAKRGGERRGAGECSAGQRGDGPGCCGTTQPRSLTEQRALYEARARILKALAHPTRLFIVDRLASGEACVCELQQLCGADMSTISKHLRILRTAGLACADKRGKQVWYKLRVPCILNFFGCVEEVLRQDALERQALLDGGAR